MATTQYIGSRYVPVFADPAEWNDTRTYEPLTIVIHEGNSYTSRQYVPTGVDITNDDFWALTSNYNAQVEQYRQETKNAVAQVDDRLSENEKNVATQLSAQNTNVSNQLSNQTSTVDKRLASNETKMNTLQSDINKQIDALSAETQQIETNKNDIAAETNRAKTAENFITTSLNKYNDMVVIGDSYSSEKYLPENEDKIWPKLVANKLKMNLHNFADPGAGYTSYGDYTHKPFSYQVDLCKADTSFSDDNVGLVLILGGTNDMSNRAGNNDNYNEYIKAISNLSEVVTSEFPNAYIVNLGSDMFQNFKSRKFASGDIFTELVVQQNIDYYWDNCANLCMLWFENNDLFTNGYVGHPNVTGHKVLANSVLKYLYGNVAFSRYIQLDTQDDFDVRDKDNSTPIDVSPIKFENSMYQVIKATNLGFDLKATFSIPKPEDYFFYHLPGNIRLNYNTIYKNKHQLNLYSPFVMYVESTAGRTNGIMNVLETNETNSVQCHNMEPASSEITHYTLKFDIRIEW